MRLKGMIARLVIVSSTAFLAIGGVVATWVRPSSAQNDSVISYTVLANDHQRTGQIVAFEPLTGNVQYQISTDAQPDVIQDKRRDRLYLLDTKWSADWKTATHTLAAINATTGEELASTSLPDRFLYPVSGPTTLVLTADSSLLWVYSYNVTGDDAADYWLRAVDPGTLKLRPERANLPGCGGAWFAVTNREIIVLCERSHSVRFLDPKTGAVNTVVQLPFINPNIMEGRGVGLAITRDQKTMYVVTNTMKIIAIDIASRSLQEINDWERQPWSVPPGGVQLSADGNALVVAVDQEQADGSYARTLNVLTIPTLKNERSIPVADLSNFVVSSVNGIFVIPRGAGELRVIDPSLSQSRGLLDLENRIDRVLP